MLNIRLYFENNNSWNNKDVNYPYIRSLAKTLMWLYSDEADGPRDQYYNIDGEIKLYQLVNIIILFVSHASQELGEATIKEYIHDMEKGEGDRWKSHDNDISEFTNKKGERGISIMWATYELVLSILWGCYIYCIVLTRLGGEEKRWQHASDLFYKIMKDESGLKPSVFNNHWLIKHTDEMVNSMLGDIERRKVKETENERNNLAKGNNDSLQHQLADAQKTIEEQAQTIDELRAEIARLNEVKDSTKSVEQNNIEINRLKVVHEEMLVTLLKPAFYNIENDTKVFLRRIQGLNNQGVTDVARQFLQDRKITPSKKGRFIWNILTAAKLYSATEQNWTAALRKVN